MSDFPVPNRDVTDQTLPGGKIANFFKVQFEHNQVRVCPEVSEHEKFACLLLIEDSPRHFPVQFRTNENCNSRNS